VQFISNTRAESISNSISNSINHVKSNAATDAEAYTLSDESSNFTSDKGNLSPTKVADVYLFVKDLTQGVCFEPAQTQCKLVFITAGVNKLPNSSPPNICASASNTGDAYLFVTVKAFASINRSFPVNNGIS
jgi:hypothetical protein